jgi:hypothetical protein
MSLKSGVAGMRWNHHDIGSGAIDRFLFDPVCDGFPSNDAALSLDVVGTIINNQQRDLDIPIIFSTAALLVSTSR